MPEKRVYEVVGMQYHCPKWVWWAWDENVPIPIILRANPANVHSPVAVEVRLGEQKEDEEKEYQLFRSTVEWKSTGKNEWTPLTLIGHIRQKDNEEQLGKLSRFLRTGRQVQGYLTHIQFQVDSWGFPEKPLSGKVEVKWDGQLPLPFMAY